MRNSNNTRTIKIITTTPHTLSIPNNILYKFSYCRKTVKVDSIWKTQNIIEK